MEKTSSDVIDSFNECYKNKRRVSHFDLSNTDFSEQNLSQLHAENSLFKYCSLKSSDLSKTRFTQCNFEQSDLQNADLSESVVRLCNFNGVNAKAVKFAGAVLEDSQITAADFAGANLKNTRLTETNWARSALPEAELNGAEGEGVSFRGADLTNANLMGVKFIDGDFRGADLSGANLSNGDFSGTDFRGAILDNIVCYETKWSGALFDKQGQPDASNSESTVNEKTAESKKVDEDVAQAVEQVVSGIFSQVTSGFKHDKDLKNTFDKIDKWNKQKKEMDIDAFSGLLDQLEKSFSGGSIMPPETISSLKTILHALSDAGRDEPSDEIKELLKKYFPEINEDGIESIDDIMSKYAAYFKSA